MYHPADGYDNGFGRAGPAGRQGDFPRTSGLLGRGSLTTNLPVLDLVLPDTSELKVPGMITLQVLQTRFRDWLQDDEVQRTELSFRPPREGVLAGPADFGGWAKPSAISQRVALPEPHQGNRDKFARILDPHSANHLPCVGCTTQISYLLVTSKMVTVK